MNYIMCMVLRVKPAFILATGCPRVDQLTFHFISVGHRSFHSRLGLNFTVFYTQQNILITIYTVLKKTSPMFLAITRESIVGFS